MTVIGPIDSGRHSARNIVVWDPLVRLIHWSFALSILLNSTIIEDESALHEWVGYIAVGLVGTRLVWGLIGPRHARFSAFPPNPIRALMVYNIWITMLALGVTGYMMGMIKFFGVEWVEEAHEIAFNWLMISVVLHIGGVMFDTWRSGMPPARAMIDRLKRITKDKSIE